MINKQSFVKHFYSFIYLTVLIIVIKETNYIKFYLLIHI
uniref:Uncharacterized protein n=1 Tax=viral metagenome TaxID=1070528 RepID=A0A6C0H8W0_9ZZZZ